MDFIKDNKGKLFIAAAAAVGGLLWMQTRESNAPDSITKIINTYIEKRLKISEEDDIKEAINKLRKDLFQILKTFVEKGNTKEEREQIYIEFFMSSFTIFYKKIVAVSEEQLDNVVMVEGYREVIGGFFAIGLMGGSLFESNENNSFNVQDCFKQMFLNGEVEEKLDTISFFFSSLQFIKEQDIVPFINARVMVDKQLKDIFLAKMVCHSHTCLRIIPGNPEQKTISKSDFFFSEHYFEMIKDIEFLKTLELPYLITSLNLFTRYCTTFNKSLEQFLLKELYMIKWQKLFQNIFSNEEYIKHLLSDKESSKAISDIYKLLTYALFTLTISFNLEDKEINNFSETFQQRLLPYCSVLIIAEQCLKTMDIFLKALKKLDSLTKFKIPFVTIIHDFMVTLVQFYNENNCSNYLNVFINTVTLLVTHFHDSVPSSKSIQKFWSSVYLPEDCNVDYILEPFFRMSLSQFFEATGLVNLVEKLAEYYNGEHQVKIRIFLQIINNKKYNFCRLRIISYQYAILQADFEDKHIQENLVQHLFKIELGQNQSSIFSLLNIGEKIMTPLHFLNQINIETAIESSEEKEDIKSEIAKYTQECSQYLLNVFKLSNLKLQKEELLSYLKNGVSSDLTLDSFKDYIEESETEGVSLKEDTVLENQMELFFDKQIEFQGFKLAKLEQNVDKPLYDTLDYIKEIQYRLFTKSFFYEYAVKCYFKNPVVLVQAHTHALVLYEVMIDFIYEALTKEPENEDQNIEILIQKLIDDKTVFQSLKSDSVIYTQTNPTAKDVTEQLLKRVEARLALIEKL